MVPGSVPVGLQPSVFTYVVYFIVLLFCCGCKIVIIIIIIIIEHRFVATSSECHQKMVPACHSNHCGLFAV